MNKLGHLFSVMVAAVLLLSASSVASAWDNGYEADHVLGQPDLTTKQPYTGATRSNFYKPWGMCLDPSTGSVFVTDSTSHRVLRWNSVDAYTDGADANGVLGQASFTTHSANRGGAVAANTLYYPDGCVVSSSGVLYVADSENNRILKFIDAVAKSDGANADGVLGQADFTSGQVNRGGAVGAGTLYLPAGGLVLDDSDNLWISDTANNRVLMYGAGWADGADAVHVLGQSDFTSSAQATTQSGMTFPAGLALTSGDDLMVADSDSSRVLIFKDAFHMNDGENADIVLGQPDFTTGNGACTVSKMHFPKGVALNSTNALFVTDSRNNRTLVFDDVLNKAVGADADKVLGQADFTSGGAATTASGLNDPVGLAYDASYNRLWVVDSENNRVITYALNGRPSVLSSTPPSGSNTGSLGVTLTGTGFLNGASVKLTKSGETDIAGTSVTVASASSITCTFDLTDVTEGTWSIVVTNPDKTSSSLEFTIEGMVVPSLQEWGMILTALLLAGFALIRIRRQAV